MKLVLKGVKSYWNLFGLETFSFILKRTHPWRVSSQKLLHDTPKYSGKFVSGPLYVRVSFCMFLVVSTK